MKFRYNNYGSYVQVIGFRLWKVIKLSEGTTEERSHNKDY